MLVFNFCEKEEGFEFCIVIIEVRFLRLYLLKLLSCFWNDRN